MDGEKERTYERSLHTHTLHTLCMKCVQALALSQSQRLKKLL